ncbi:MAG: acetolactate decarboxylase [Planctomycetota bacterium]|jgi:acetolactate decarboxylase
MFRVGVVVAGACAALGVQGLQSERDLVFEEITIDASDGVSVSGYVHETEGAKGTIVLFHTTGSNFAGEFGGVIGDRLVGEGFTLVGFDTRVGGDHPSGVNRTMQINMGVLASPVQAYADIEAGFEYARERFDGPMFVWGSGYAGVLAMRLSTERGEDVDGVLGFSPILNRRHAEGLTAEDYVDVMTVPCFLAWNTAEWTRPVARRFRERASSEGITMHLQPRGVHGSLMLDPDVVRGGGEELWVQVLAFLNSNTDADDGENPATVRTWGSMREAIGMGQSEGRVSLGDLEMTSSTFGLGAMADLDGEIIVLGGVAHVGATDGTPQRASNRAPRGTDRATMLVLADVPSWREITLESSMSLDELDERLRALQEEHSLSQSEPMAFVIEGTLENVSTHIMRGTCPTQIRGEELKHPGRPFRERLDLQQLTLVGFYAPNHAGVITHHGSTLHVHSLSGGDNPLAAHVDEITIPSGSTLRIPAPE